MPPLLCGEESGLARSQSVESVSRADWSYVNVRRIARDIREGVAAGMQIRGLLQFGCAICPRDKHHLRGSLVSSLDPHLSGVGWSGHSVGHCKDRIAADSNSEAVADHHTNPAIIVRHRDIHHLEVGIHDEASNGGFVNPP